jgi:hypothetical protein
MAMFYCLGRCGRADGWFVVKDRFFDESDGDGVRRQDSSKDSVYWYLESVTYLLRSTPIFR